MENADLIKKIRHIADTAETRGQTIKIDFMRPEVSISRGENDEHFFQDDRAEKLLAQAQRVISDLGNGRDRALSVKEVLLFQIQVW